MLFVNIVHKELHWYKSLWLHENISCWRKCWCRGASNSIACDHHQSNAKPPTENTAIRKPENLESWGPSAGGLGENWWSLRERSAGNVRKEEVEETDDENWSSSTMSIATTIMIQTATNTTPTEEYQLQILWDFFHCLPPSQQTHLLGSAGSKLFLPVSVLEASSMQPEHDVSYHLALWIHRRR